MACGEGTDIWAIGAALAGRLAAGGGAGLTAGGASAPKAADPLTRGAAALSPSAFPQNLQKSAPASVTPRQRPHVRVSSGAAPVPRLTTWPGEMAAEGAGAGPVA